MANMNFDAEDTALIAVVAFSAAVMAGLGSFTAFQVSLSDTFSIGGTTFSLAYAITLGAFALTVVTNDMDIGNIQGRAKRELDDAYYWMLMISAATLLLWPFVSGIESFVTSQDLWGVLFVAASVGAQVAIGYMR
jgi:hypothetical protein